MPHHKNAPTSEQLLAYSRVFEDLSDPVIVQDMSGNLLDMNPEAERAYGWTRDELLGKSSSVLVPVERHAVEKELFRRCAQRELVRNVETIRRTKQGKEQVVLLTLSLLTNEFNESVAIASVTKNISELKQSQREAKRRAEELERSNEKLREFTGMVSHDLQAPLRGIVGFARLLRKEYSGRLDKKADEYLDFIADSVERMQTLIDDLLEYARADSESLDLQPTDCEALVKEALANLHAAITDTEARVTHQTLPTVSASRVHLLEVFQNVIGNALKYCGDRPPEVHIQANGEEDEWVFSIRDNGIGIDPEKRKEVFRPFRRLQSQDAFDGTGLGLSTCKRIIDRHHGQIWVESEPGGGSVFYFTIPK